MLSSNLQLHAHSKLAVVAKLRLSEEALPAAVSTQPLVTRFLQLGIHLSAFLRQLYLLGPE